MRDLKGKTAIVTGGGQGIGKAITLRLAEEGCNIAIFDLRPDTAEESAAEARKSQVRTVDRSERIRTYNFPENRVTDHRINFTIYKLDQVLAGNLQLVTDALIDHDREELRSSMKMTE